MRKLIILFILLITTPLWATGNKITIDGVANVVSINGSTFTAVDGVTGTASSTPGQLGTSTVGASSTPLSKGWAIINPTTATQTGSLYQAHVHSENTAASEVVVCVYNRPGGETTVDGSETLVGGSLAISVTDTAGWYVNDATGTGFNVTQNGTYWIMLWGSASVNNAWVMDYTSASGAFYNTAPSGTYPTCPSTLGTGGGWNAWSPNPVSMYFTTH